MRCRAARVLAVVSAFPIAVPCATAVAEQPALGSAATFALDLSQAAAEPEARGPGAENWWCQLDLALWLPGIDGTLGVRDVSTNIDVSFADVLRDSDSVIGFSGALLFGRGRLGGYVDGFWSRIAADAGTPFGTAHLISEIGILDFGVSYEIGRWPMEWTASGGEPARDLVLVAFTGGRYTDIDMEVNFPVLATRQRDEGWVDPMIGARVDFPLSQHWSLGFRGDVGGFGAASDFAWTAIGAVSWDFRIAEFPSSVKVGYMAIGDDYSTGSGADRFVWDTILHGMMFTFSMQF